MNDIKKLAKLLKDADENAQAKGITDYNDAILDNAEYLIKHGVVVEVVRCKDCKYSEEHHYEHEGEKPYIKLSCKFDKYYSKSPNGFCYYGERSENGKRTDN